MATTSVDVIREALGHDTEHCFRDEWFDQIFPPHIQDLSGIHWTPVAVARRAAQMLVTKPGTKILDIGAGVGKFCIAGAVSTEGHFTGVEQRKHLAEIGENTIAEQGIANARMICASITSIPFRDFDAFYLFNPFEENLVRSQRIDSAVELTAPLYRKYTAYVASQLALAPLGTRVVTYCGVCEEIPTCYACEESAFGGALQLWVKTRQPIKAREVLRKSRPTDAQQLLEWLWPAGTPSSGTV